MHWLLISCDQPFFPPHYEKIQEVRIITHLSLLDECLLNISYQSPAPTSIVSLHPLDIFDKFKEGTGDLSEANQGYPGSKREINLNEPIFQDN